MNLFDIKMPANRWLFTRFYAAIDMRALETRFSCYISELNCLFVCVCVGITLTHSKVFLIIFVLPIGLSIGLTKKKKNRGFQKYGAD